MEKIKEFINTKKSEKLAILILFNIIYVFCLGYIALSAREIMFEASLGCAVFAIINIFTIALIIKKGYLKKNIVYLCILLIAIFSIISCIFAYKPKIAFFGYIDRYEGLIAIFYYLSVIVLSSFVVKKYRKVITLFIIVFGVIQTLYAILQIFGAPFVILVYNPNALPDISLWATGFLINPNFLGTCTLLCIALSIGLYLDEEDSKKNIIYLVLIALFMFGILISDTLSCLVGLAAILAFLLIYCIKNKLLKKFFIIIAIIIGIFAIAVLLNKTKLHNDIIKTGGEAASISTGNVDSSYGTKRLFIWSETLKVLPKYWLHGIGIDNFPYAFDGSILTYYGKTRIFHYDKAHNEYLQILITEGVFCLISYLVMYATIGIKGIKNSFKTKKTYLILPVIGYLVQAFFNISVIVVAPLFFIILGLCLAESNE